jgi:hypothetical protein
MCNEKRCPFCGQQRPFPTEPGKWEYTHPIKEEWISVEARLEEGILRLFLEGDDKPLWWPNYAIWRKRKENQ